MANKIGPAVSRELGLFTPIPDELITKILSYLEKSIHFERSMLPTVSLLNRGFKQIVENYTRWGEAKKSFRVFNGFSLPKNQMAQSDRRYYLDFWTGTCFFYEPTEAGKTILKEQKFPIKESRHFSLSEHVFVCISQDYLQCGRLVIDPENLSVSFSPLEPFITRLPAINLIFTRLPHIYNSEFAQKGKELHITWLIQDDNGNSVSQHLLIYEIDPASPSTCYLKQLNDYFRMQGVAALISNIHRIAVENPLRVVQQIDFPRQRPRKYFYQVLGVDRDLLILHRSVMGNAPDSMLFFLDRLTLKERFSCNFLKLNGKGLGPSVLGRIYRKDTIFIFYGYGEARLTIDQKVFQLTPQTEELLSSFDSITDFSYSLLDNGNYEFAIEGKLKEEQVKIKAVVNPSVPLSDLTSPPIPPAAPSHEPPRPPPNNPLPPVTFTFYLVLVLKTVVTFLGIFALFAWSGKIYRAMRQFLKG